MDEADDSKLKEEVKAEVEEAMRESGESASFEVGVHGLHPDLIRLLGIISILEIPLSITSLLYPIPLTNVSPQDTVSPTSTTKLPALTFIL